ncbi:hypothetical protein PGT21_001239 [Puccinia graminis f. sp. tritici]|uniref:Uncharacterized protein n=1 Tax=Puccinia graminis f. sp. tritici TaxID=56615 RepID=A0A5B0P4S0_PUCGR|nr:hypothetical protein PGT21_001239 [Puccinia graminis f. sp. tritici]
MSPHREAQAKAAPPPGPRSSTSPGPLFKPRKDQWDPELNKIQLGPDPSPMHQVDLELKLFKLEVDPSRSTLPPSTDLELKEFQLEVDPSLEVDTAPLNRPRAGRVSARALELKELQLEVDPSVWGSDLELKGFQPEVDPSSDRRIDLELKPFQLEVGPPPSADLELKELQLEVDPPV